jgi:hypothetical protein
MDNGDDRRSGNPITTQVAEQTADWMGHECTHHHQGQSHSAPSQAEYRRAVRSPLPIASTILAPLGESI